MISRLVAVMLPILVMPGIAVAVGGAPDITGYICDADYQDPPNGKGYVIMDPDPTPGLADEVTADLVEDLKLLEGLGIFTLQDNVPWPCGDGVYDTLVE